MKNLKTYVYSSSKLYRQFPFRLKFFWEACEYILRMTPHTNRLKFTESILEGVKAMCFAQTWNECNGTESIITQETF